MTVYVIRYRGRVFHQTSHRDDHHRMLNRLTQRGHNLNDNEWEISEWKSHPAQDPTTYPAT